MKERIQIAVDYEIEYEGIKGREAAIEAALEGAIDLRGRGPGGAYRATRLTKTIAGGTAMDMPKQEALL